MSEKVIASTRQTARVDKRSSGAVLIIEYETKNARQEWILPEKTDHAKIREIGEAAKKFALSNGASPGQVRAVLKALSDEGYYQWPRI